MISADSGTSASKDSASPHPLLVQRLHSVTMGENKDHEHHVDGRQIAEIELENAAVLLDADAAKAGASVRALKLAKDGHVSMAGGESTKARPTDQ